MKISYQFVTEKIEIDVDEQWGEILLNEDRLEYNNNHKETRRHVTLDDRDDPGQWLTGLCDMDDMIIRKEITALVVQAVSQLHPRQRDLIYALYLSARPLTQAEYARQQGITELSVKQNAWRARKNLKSLIAKIFSEKL